MKLHPSTRALKLAPLFVVAAFVSMMLMGDAALGVQQYPTILNPTTGYTFPQRRLTNAQTCPVTQQCNAVGTLSGIVSVKLAAAPLDGDVLAIVDADGNAAVNTLTVQGNGHNIDGAATQAITLSGGAIVAQYSTAAAEWVSISFQRKLAGAKPAVFLNVDARPAATTGANTLAGDVTGPASANTAVKINGTTVPAGGALSTGQILRATGIAAAAWGALDLANASAVTGTLPAARGGTGLTAFPGPGTSGNILTSNGSAWTSSPAPSSGGGWQTGVSVSFAGAADPGLAANGTYVLAGLTVKRENAVNDRVAMSVGAGGVSIAPNASSYLPSSNLRSAPLLWFSIPVALDWTTSLRLSIRISSSSQGIFDNGHNVYVGLDTDSTSFASWCGQGTNAFLGRLFDSGVAVSGVGQFSNRAAGGAASTGAFVLTCEIPQILKPELEALALYRDAVAAWPDFSTLSPVVGVASLRSPFDALNPSNVAVSTRLGIVVAADAPSSSDAYTVTISDIRLDYRL